MLQSRVGNVNIELYFLQKQIRLRRSKNTLDEAKILRWDLALM